MTRDEREKVVGRHILKRIGVGQIEKLVPLWTDCSRPPLTFQMIKLKCFDSRNSREDVMMNRWQNWKLKSKTTIITYPEIWFLELPAAIFLRPLLWLTPATLNLNTYSEGGMGLWCWKVAFAVNLHCLCSWWPGFLAAVPFLKGAFNKQWHRTFAFFAIFDMPQVFTFTIIRW